MIDLYYWTTPNGHKITLMLEETGLDYQIKPINISKGDQFNPDFLSFAPNNRSIIVVKAFDCDRDVLAADGGEHGRLEVEVGAARAGEAHGVANALTRQAAG